MNLFRGAGSGGGGDARGAQEDTNSLQSKAYARLIDLISEGPIEGFATKDGITITDAVFAFPPVVNPAGFTGLNGNFGYNEGTVDVVAFDHGEAPYHYYIYYGYLPTPAEYQVVNGVDIRHQLPLMVAQDGAGSKPVGYPFVLDGIPLIVIGNWLYDNKGNYREDYETADMVTLILPQNETQQGQTLAAYTATSGDHAALSVGQVVVHCTDRSSTVRWLPTTEELPGYLHVKVTAVDAGTTFHGVVWPIDIGGRPYAVKLKASSTGWVGKQYDPAKTSAFMPAASAQAIFFNNTPMADPYTLAYNYTFQRMVFRNGTDAQEPLDGFENTEAVAWNEGAREIDYLYHGWGTAYPAASAPQHKGDAVPYGTELSVSDLPGMDEPLEIVLHGNYTSLRVNLLLPNGLYYQDVKNGDLKQIVPYNGVPDSHAIVPPSIVVKYRVNDDPVWHSFGPKDSYQFTGKTTAAYEYSIEGVLYHREYVPDAIDAITLGFWRTTTDDAQHNNATAIHTKVQLSSVVGITNVKLRYPFCALVGIELDASQFNSIPKRAYRMKLLQVPVPSNYFPPFSRRRRTLNGMVVEDWRPFAEYCRVAGTQEGVYDEKGNPVDQVWDGSFYVSWTNNPAWITYSVRTQERTGVGNFMQTDASTTDYLEDGSKWLFYRVGRYCDEPVACNYTRADGLQVKQEARYTCSTYVQATTEAWRLFTDLASSFGGYVYYANGSVIPVQDRPRTPRLSFTPANVEGGLFQYVGTSLLGRHSAAVGRFSNPDNFYGLSPELYQDDSLVDKLGWRLLDKTLFGCTSRGQAQRAVHKALLMEKELTNTVRFATGLMGSVLRPGDVISVYDPSRSAVPFGGRLLRVDRSSTDQDVLVLDRLIPDAALQALNSVDASAYSVVVQKPTASTEMPNLASLEDVQNYLASQLSEPIRVVGFGKGAEGTTTLTLGAPLTFVAVPGAIWGLQRSSVQPQLFQVLQVSETTKHRFEVLGLEYNDSLYDAVERGLGFTSLPIAANLDKWQLPTTPTNLHTMLSAKLVDGKRQWTLNLSWTPSMFARGYEVEWKRSLANFQALTTTSLTNIEVVVPEADSYTFRVRTVGLTGSKSDWEQMVQLIGSLDILNREVISGLELYGQGNATTFTTAEIRLAWRVNWSGAGSDFHTDVPPQLPPNVESYEVNIYTVAGVLIATQSVPATSFILTVDQNKALPGGPYRELMFGLRAMTVDKLLSAETVIRVSNDKPALLSGGDFSYSVTNESQLLLNFAPTLPLDFDHYCVWLSTTDGFTPSDANLTYTGSSSTVLLALVPGTIYFVRVAMLDRLAASNLDCNLSAQFSVTGNRITSASSFDAFGKTW